MVAQDENGTITNVVPSEMLYLMQTKLTIQPDGYCLYEDITGCISLKTLDCSSNWLYDKSKAIIGLADVQAHGCKIYT